MAASRSGSVRASAQQHVQPGGADGPGARRVGPQLADAGHHLRPVLDRAAAAVVVQREGDVAQLLGQADGAGARVVVEARALVGHQHAGPAIGAVGQRQGADHGAAVGLVGDVAGGDHGRTVLAAARRHTGPDARGPGPTPAVGSWRPRRPLALVLAACSSSPSTPKAGPAAHALAAGPAVLVDHHDHDRPRRVHAGARVDVGAADGRVADPARLLGRPRHRRREPRRRRVRRAAGSDQPRPGRRLGRRRQRPRRHRRARARRHRRPGRRRHQLLRGDLRHGVRLRPGERQPGRAVDDAGGRRGQQLERRPGRHGGRAAARCTSR